MLEAELRKKLEAISNEEAEIRIIVAGVESTLAASKLLLFEQNLRNEKSIQEIQHVTEQLSGMQTQQEELKKMLCDVERINNMQENELTRIEDGIHLIQDSWWRVNLQTLIILVVFFLIILHVTGVL